MDPLISVIITTYKRKKEYLKQALDSVVYQSYKNIELIVVDDNGKGTQYQHDNEELIKNYGNIIYIINEKNSGAQYSRNIGILSSSGEYLAFLDDDDFWVENKIEKQLECFNKYPEAGLIFSDGYIFNDGDIESKVRYQPHEMFNTPIDLNMMLYMDYVGCTSQVLIRRECFASVGVFDPNMPARQDYEMWVRVSKKYPLYGCPNYLFYHRMHMGEQISANMEKVYIGYRNIYLKNKNDYNNNHIAKTRMMMILCKKSVENHKCIKAVIYFIMGCISQPTEAIKEISKKIKKL